VTSPVLTDGVRLLEHLGFSFPMDFDGDVLIESPSEVRVSDIVALLLERGNKEIVDRTIRFRARRNMRVCVGGPMNGQRHDGRFWSCELLYHLGRAEWAAYLVSPDGRAYFVGMATSKKR